MAGTLAVAGATFVAKVIYDEINRWRDKRNTGQGPPEKIMKMIEEKVGTDFSSIPEEDCPTIEDVENMCESYAEEYKKASNNKKRKMLRDAFFSYFKPEYYQAGMNRILWDYVRQLEYPDAVFLKDIDARIRGSETVRGHLHSYTTHKMTGAVTSKSAIVMQVVDPDIEPARRLSSMGLLERQPDPTNEDRRVFIPYLGLCEQLREFIWSWDAATP